MGGACFAGNERAVCFDRCCSGVCEQHIACGDLGSGGWRCKGNLEVEGLAPDVPLSDLVSAPGANVTHPTAPPCVEVNQCTKSAARCCSGYGHQTYACGGGPFDAGYRCDPAPQQLESPKVPEPAAPEPLQNLEEPKPDDASLAGEAQCLGDGMCCEYTDQACALCCSGTHHRTLACGNHGSRCGQAADFENT